MSASLEPVTSLLSTLAELDVTPSSLRVEWPFTDEDRPDVVLWLRTRTDFERITKSLGLRTTSAAGVGHRKFWTTADRPAPLVQCASFPHHDDYDTTTPTPKETP